jgi:hypothetical protein
VQLLTVPENDLDLRSLHGNTNPCWLANSRTLVLDSRPCRQTVAVNAVPPQPNAAIGMRRKIKFRTVSFKAKMWQDVGLSFSLDGCSAVSKTTTSVRTRAWLGCHLVGAAVQSRHTSGWGHAPRRLAFEVSKCKCCAITNLASEQQFYDCASNPMDWCMRSLAPASPSDGGSTPSRHSSAAIASCRCCCCSAKSVLLPWLLQLLR